MQNLIKWSLPKSTLIYAQNYYDHYQGLAWSLLSVSHVKFLKPCSRYIIHTLNTTYIHIYTRTWSLASACMHVQVLSWLLLWADLCFSVRLLTAMSSRQFFILQPLLWIWNHRHQTQVRNISSYGSLLLCVSALPSWGDSMARIEDTEASAKLEQFVRQIMS